MKDIKAIFLDLDGTSLLPDHTVSPLLIETLDKIREKEVEVVVCTGRNFSGSLNAIGQLKIQNYAINYNGARITDLKSGEILSETELPAEIVEKLIYFAHQHNLHLNLYHNDLLYVETETEEALFYKEVTGTDYHQINLKGFIGNPSTKAAVIANSWDVPHIIKLLKEEFPNNNIMTSGVNLIEILPKGLSKATGVKFITERLNIDPKNTMAFGDQWNDYEMLQFVEYGYLMGNAPKALKDKIPENRHTLANTEDGIVHILQNII